MRAWNEEHELGKRRVSGRPVCLSTADEGRVKLKRTAKACLKGKRVMRTTHNLHSADKEVAFGDNGEDLKLIL